jgi:alcohol dehydrogenase
MHAFEFHTPTKIVCGADSLHKLPHILEERNVTKPLVVTGPNLLARGTAEKVTVPLEENGILYELFSEVPADTPLATVNQIASRYQAEGCDGFIALGGGSVIDATKGADASVSTGCSDFATLQGADNLTATLDPLIAIPTTAGTGSEVTLVAVVKDESTDTKLSFTSYQLCPHVAILDPSLTTSLPPALTITTAVDALTHAIEAYTSIQKNPVSDAFAHGAIKLIAQNLDQACRYPKDEDARAGLALGSLMAGCAFSNAMVGLVHALGHALGGLCHIPHGQAMTILLPHCVRWNLDQGYNSGLYGKLLADLRPDKASRSLSPKQADEAVSAELFSQNEHFHRTYGTPITLSELGVNFEDLPVIANKARYDGAALYNVQEVTVEAAMAILEAAF